MPWKLKRFIPLLKKVLPLKPKNHKDIHNQFFVQILRPLMKSFMFMVVMTFCSCLTVSAQEQKELPFITVNEMIELATPEKLDSVKIVLEKHGYKFRGGKSKVMRAFYKGVTMDQMNRVTSIADEKTSSVVSYSEEDGVLSLDVFSEENIIILKNQIEDAGFKVASEAETLTRYTKDGGGSFTIMKYIAAGKQAYSVSYSK